MNDACKHVKISAHHRVGTVVHLECVASAKWSYKCLEKANINDRSERLPMFAFKVHPNLSKQIASRDVKKAFNNRVVSCFYVHQDVITCTNA